MRADLRAFGAAQEQIEHALGPPETDFAVWPENWDAVQAFLAVQTQWATGFSGPTGLDYSRVRAGWELAGIAVTPELFHQLRIMELTVLDTLKSPKS